MGGGRGESDMGNSKQQLKQQCLIHFGNNRGGCEGQALLWSMCCVLGHYSMLVYKWLTVNLVLGVKLQSTGINLGYIFSYLFYHIIISSNQLVSQ